MAAIAFFIAVTGAGAYAAATIGAGNIQDNAVRSRHIKDGQVKNAELASGAVGPLKVKPQSLGGGSINEAKLDATPLRTRVGQGGCRGNDPKDVMVKAGSTCIDRYEASVWSKLNGGTQYGTTSDDYPCDDTGKDCKGKIYARSVAGVKPSAYITWFQAQQALANAGKRLPTNAEWQQAVAGTPDSTACNVGPAPQKNTGASPGCVSAWGANDMVGNVLEWVADWDEQAGGCADWPAAYGSDRSCVGSASGEASTRFPAALIRGGSSDGGSFAGSFAINAATQPSSSAGDQGFRGLR